MNVAACYELRRDHLKDRHKLSPYLGRTFHGLVRRTMVRGRTVFLEGRIMDEAFGPASYINLLGLRAGRRADQPAIDAVECLGERRHRRFFFFLSRALR